MDTHYALYNKLLKQLTCLLIILLLLVGVPVIAAENRPFPQNIERFGITPNNESVNKQNTAVQNFYIYWRDKYLTPSAKYTGYYINGGDALGDGKGTSESHGFGMLVTVLMAGPNNPAAKEQFDGMYDYYDSHRAKGWKPPQADNEYLMGWKIDDSESGTGSYDSATDGDMDIAYALLLADKQWGSNGKINYHQAAVDMINKGIRVFDYHGDSRRLMLGNWDSHPNTTRTSDWMPGHLRAYYDATGDAEWLSAIATIYTMVDELNTYNGGTGIMPDFVTGDTAVPDFDAENGIGDEYSDTFGDYYYNAARTPLRLAMDFIHNGDTSSKAAADQLIAWAKTEIGVVPNFNAFCSGYTVKGEAQIGDGKSYGCPVGDKGSTAFVAPVVVAASVSEAHQAFVNDGWNYIKENQSGYYYQDTINLLSMLALTGNWWAPNEL